MTDATNLLAAVHNHDVDDIEIGAAVWSTTHQLAHGPLGGVVIGYDDEAETVDVVRMHHGHPTVDTIPTADIDPGTIEYYSKNARALAAGIHTWLGRRDNKRLDAADRARWSGIAANLDNVALTGLYLPHAAARYQAAVDAMRTEREAS